MGSTKPQRLLAGLALVLGSLATFWPTWDAPFAEDDYLFLEVAQAAGPWGLLRYLWAEGVMDHHYRPLSDPLWFAVAGHPMVYHLGLQALHAGAALLVFSLGKALGLASRGSWLGALLWATRDCAFPSMVWASGFSDVGSTFFALVALRAHAAFVAGRGAGPRVAALAAFAAAVLTKETAVVTLFLLPLVGWLVGRRRLREMASDIGPYVLVAIPVACVQVGLARFDETYGRSLYALSAGAHTLWLWPVYFVWSFLALPGLPPIGAARVALAVGALIAWAAIVVWGARYGRIAVLGGVWFTLAVLPALFAPARINTNYAMLPAVGTCLAAGWLFARALRRGPLVACMLALLLAAGPTLVLLKDSGRLPSGGWVDLGRARTIDTIVRELVVRAAPSPPPEATLVLFGAAPLNLAVLGDVGDGSGFGPRSTLESALRWGYGRRDLRVVALPPVGETAASHLEFLRTTLLGERMPLLVLDVDVEGSPRELTATALAAAREAAGTEGFRRALAR